MTRRKFLASLFSLPLFALIPSFLRPEPKWEPVAVKKNYRGEPLRFLYRAPKGRVPSKLITLPGYSSTLGYLPPLSASTHPRYYNRPQHRDPYPDVSFDSNFVYLDLRKNMDSPFLRAHGPRTISEGTLYPLPPGYEWGPAYNEGIYVVHPILKV